MQDNHYLKLTYSEILRGYSSFFYNKRLTYIKHLNQLDISLIDIKRQEYIEYFKSKSVPTSSEKLEKIISNGSWTQEKDKEIDEIKSFILNLQHTKKKHTIKKDKDLVDKEIEKYNERFIKLIIEKDKLMGKTADTRANRKIGEYYLFISLYKSPDLETKLFDEEEFDFLDEIELNKLQKLYNEKTCHLDLDNLKRIALMPYFFNLYVLAGDNLINLFGKPLINLTTYQIELIQNAKNYKNILQNSKNPPPPECLSDPQKLLEWFDKSESLDKVMENTQVEEAHDKKILVAAKSMVGATREELKEMGADTSVQDKITDELKKRQEKGLSGEIGMMDLIKMGA